MASNWDTRNILVFVIADAYLDVTAVSRVREEMDEWVKENKLNARCLGTFVNPQTFEPEIKWMVPDDKEKTMFELTWR